MWKRFILFLTFQKLFLNFYFLLYNINFGPIGRYFWVNYTQHKSVYYTIPGTQNLSQAFLLSPGGSCSETPKSARPSSLHYARLTMDVSGRVSIV